MAVHSSTAISDVNSFRTAMLEFLLVGVQYFAVNLTKNNRELLEKSVFNTSLVLNIKILSTWR